MRLPAGRRVNDLNVILIDGSRRGDTLRDDLRLRQRAGRDPGSLYGNSKRDWLLVRRGGVSAGRMRQRPRRHRYRETAKQQALNQRLYGQTSLFGLPQDPSSREVFLSTRLIRGFL